MVPSLPLLSCKSSVSVKKNPEKNYFLFMISLGRRNGDCDIDEETFDRICLPK